MTPEANIPKPAQMIGVFPDVDLVLVVDHAQSAATKSQIVARFFRVHMDVLIEDDDVWNKVSAALRDRDHRTVYRTLIEDPTNPPDTRGHNTLKAALGQ